MSERVYQAHANDVATRRDTSASDVARAHYDYAYQAHQTAVLLAQHAARLAEDADKTSRAAAYYRRDPGITMRMADGRILPRYQALALAGEELRVAASAATARAAVQHERGLEFGQFAASQVEV